MSHITYLNNLVKNDSEIVSVLIFCDTLYKNHENGIYMYNDNKYYTTIKKMDYMVIEYIIQNYGILFIIPSGNESYNIRIIMNKKKYVCTYYYDTCYEKYTHLINNIISKIKNNIVKDVKPLNFSTQLKSI